MLPLAGNSPYAMKTILEVPALINSHLGFLTDINVLLHITQGHTSISILSTTV